MRLSEICLLASLVPLALAACDKKEGDSGDGNADEGPEAPAESSDGAPADMAPELHWYSTCGDPACGGYSGPWQGVPACGPIAEGDSCAVAGESCDFMSDCNAQMLCTTSD